VTRIVTLGDSMTIGMGNPDGEGGYCGWARYLAAGLPDPEVHNLAVIGAHATHVERDQLPPALKLRPDVASVVLGSNDVLWPGFDPWVIGQTASRIVAALQASGAIVLTMQLPDPARVFGLLPAMVARPVSRRTDAVNAEIDKVAARYETLHWEAGRDPETYDRCNWSVDRMHPSDRGQRLIASRFWDMLAAADHPVATQPDREPTSPGPTRRDDLRWIATTGTRWFLRRSADIVPYLLFMALREWMAGPERWVTVDSDWLPGIGEKRESTSESVLGGLRPRVWGQVRAAPSSNRLNFLGNTILEPAFSRKSVTRGPDSENRRTPAPTQQPGASPAQMP
jgi:lysophospholipase L1-like esterase